MSKVRIKRSVQAQFNTDLSHIAASARTAAQSNGDSGVGGGDGENLNPNDPMAQAEANARSKAAPSGFVAATRTLLPASPNISGGEGPALRNEEAIGGDDDDDIL